ncbi:MAG: bifunctional folylpolyglutamate synthase/dihydrofolate synthase [Chloroflexi bacterium]|nr:bifunctional folylpolyglutamate synthase/dihydrofolate synthase [Chloroflexota bacterium]
MTTFEVLTAMAFRHFAESSGDFQVLEVGLGGTLDATNVITEPQVCLITSISLDHTGGLGPTVEHIARDKAGIIKPGAIVVTAPQPPKVIAILEDTCQQKGALLVKVGEGLKLERNSWDLAGQRFRVWTPRQEYRLWMPLLGGYQLENAACILAVLEALEQRGVHISLEAVKKGFETVQWPGRMEPLSQSPLVVADGAHNPYSMEKLGEALRSYLSYERLLLIVGFSHGHDVEETARIAAGWNPAVTFATRSRHPRAVAPGEVAALFRQQGLESVEVAEVVSAQQQAREMARPGDLVLATGSLFVVAELREALLGIAPEIYPELEPSHLSQKVV